MQMVLNRNFTLRTIFGHSVRFREGVPIHVPYNIVPEAQKIGALPVKGETVTPDDSKPPPEPIGEERENLIVSAVRKIIERNNPDHFTAGGVPKQSAVKQIVGFEPNRTELRKHSNAVRTEIATRDEQ